MMDRKGGERTGPGLFNANSQLLIGRLRNHEKPQSEQLASNSEFRVATFKYTERVLTIASKCLIIKKVVLKKGRTL
jgi:hypothetical protein